jgi:hypothetical protein
MRKAIAVSAGLVLVASVSLASNTGFKLNYPLVFNPGSFSNLNWMSFPYFYFPNGNVGATPQNANDMCFDANGAPPPDESSLRAVQEFNTATDTYRIKNCSSLLKVFDIATGKGYAGVPTKAGVTWAVVGSHDDDYAGNKLATKSYPLVFNPGSFSNLNWMSVPYHSIADNANDLCTEVNSAPPPDASSLTAVQEFNTATDTYRIKNCSSLLKVFDLVPGKGYAFVPTKAAVTVQLDVY